MLHNTPYLEAGLTLSIKLVQSSYVFILHGLQRNPLCPHVKSWHVVLCEQVCSPRDLQSQAMNEPMIRIKLDCELWIICRHLTLPPVVLIISASWGPRMVVIICPP